MKRSKGRGSKLKRRQVQRKRSGRREDTKKGDKKGKKYLKTRDRGKKTLERESKR